MNTAVETATGNNGVEAAASGVATASDIQWSDDFKCSHGGREWRIYQPKTVWGGPIRRGVMLQVLTEHGWHTLKSSDTSDQVVIYDLKQWVKKGVESGMRCFSDDEVEI